MVSSPTPVNSSCAVKFFCNIIFSLLSIIENLVAVIITSLNIISDRLRIRINTVYASGSLISIKYSII